ncbi:MAG: GatB/YqeY domain-containing protein [Actinomycetes bacterium]
MDSLKDRLQHDLTDAMRAHDEVARETLRMALAAIQRAEVAGKEQVQLDDDAIVGVLQTEVRKRTEAADAYAAGGRTDRADRERAEAAVLAAYLPASLSDEELGAIVAEEVARAAGEGLDGGRAMGAVVKAVRARAGAGTEGGRIAAAVKAALA